MRDSTEPLKTIFEQALLANAAYAKLAGIPFEGTETNSVYIEKLQAAFGGSEATARYFAQRFGVVHHQPDTESGFSATLFRRRTVEAGDTSGDFTFAIRGTELSDGDDLLNNVRVFLSGMAPTQGFDMFT